MKRSKEYSDINAGTFSPMRQQVDRNIINEWRDLPLHCLNPKIALAIADVIQECEKQSK